MIKKFNEFINESSGLRSYGDSKRPTYNKPNNSVLFPKGGVLPGHEKEIKDKNFGDYRPTPDMSFSQTNRGRNIATDKWNERFEDYFGTKSQDLVYKFLEYFGRYVNDYNENREEYKEWRKNKPDTVGDKISNLINLIEYDDKFNDIIKHFGILPTDDGVDKLSDLFPQMQYTYEHMMKNRKFRGETFENKKND